MELRDKIVADHTSLFGVPYSEEGVSFHEYLERAREYCRTQYTMQLWNYRTLRPTDIDAPRFMQEYTWCVYVSGFNARVITKKWDAISKALLLPDPYTVQSAQLHDMWPVFKNSKKFLAVKTTARILTQLGWDAFKATFLPGKVQDLRMIGPITSKHLLRNIGYDVVKPDLHMERLAEKLGFADRGVDWMCLRGSEWLEERIGVVDFCMWSYASDFSRGRKRRGAA